MVEPLCKKYRGNLDYRIERDFWVCKECGSIHIYVEGELNDEQIRLKELNARMETCTDHIKFDLEELKAIVEALKQQAQTLNCGPQTHDIIDGIVQHNYELLYNSDQIAKRLEELIESLQQWVTPCDGGHFELLSEIMQ